ncbi:tRNA (adenosine(37)-N6)-dimethylallyltransferase MiaA [Hyunsoonleella flava]|uniref:tRNA dimethylallyltransferase n=1 Tax=Hyunsoonleella flava TaxID=2527939 RepID=A0A4Q9FBK2_9FLAO|nr:tRNA (adenosine(37)-N6)-dimethylallyltransferase MiaA [Hyunsoonleella flava]TBM99752.1 tRNA (adenosine(37)-N6)-dimethylallyltransferase MiaA [Hyunsoonleella flava]
MEQKQKYLITIVGPTAIGKTALSIKLAQHFKTEIISADSRQFYKEMQIGTAAPSQQELSAAKHHFIHHKSITDNYSVGSFEKDALQLLKTLFEKHNTVIMVGGSGLYVDAVVKGLDHFPDIDPSIRKQLNFDLETKGISHLQKQLKALDEKSFNTIAVENPHRIIRALEVSLGTGKPYSSFLNQGKQHRDFKTISIGLTADREIVYHRINQRVDIMLKEGLLDEIKALIPHKDLNALNTVGYKELFKYFEGEWTLDFAISEIKKNTRRFAKRQGTWFRKNENTTWFNYRDDISKIITSIEIEMI